MSIQFSRTCTRFAQSTQLAQQANKVQKGVPSAPRSFIEELLDGLDDHGRLERLGNVPATQTSCPRSISLRVVFAVSMITGMCLVDILLLIKRQTSKPSNSGSMIASSTRSGGSSARASRAAWPPVTPLTSYPLAVNSMLSSSSRLFSGSTTRFFFLGPLLLLLQPKTQPANQSPAQTVIPWPRLKTEKFRRGGELLS